MKLSHSSHSTPLLIFLILLGIYRASLLGSGAFAWPDEHLYNDSLRTIAALLDGNFQKACTALTGFGARPAEATLRLIPAAIQIWLERSTGIPLYNPQSLMIPAAFNVISSLLLSYFFYRVSFRLFADERWPALIAAIVFSLLVSSNVFVRHIIPYDTALAFCLLSLLLALRRAPKIEERIDLRRQALVIVIVGAGILIYPVTFLISRTAAKFGAVLALLGIIAGLAIAYRADRIETRHWMLIGIIAGIGLAIYPAYYPFPVAVGAIIALRAETPPFVGLSLSRLRAGLHYGLGMLAVMFFYEVIARIGDVSYLASAVRLSGTITQGSFEEGYIFIPRFFIEVEGAIGIVVLTGAIAYICLAGWRLIRRAKWSETEAALGLCVAIFGGLYLVYATQSTVLHKMAFTGRYARMYFPVVILMAIASLRYIPALSWRLVAQAGMVLVAVYSFAGFAREYYSLAYPVDVLYTHGIKWEDISQSARVYEGPRISQEWVSTAHPRGITRTNQFVTVPGDERYVLLNFGYFSGELSNLPAFTPPRDARLIYQGPHFLTFRSSGFEGFTIEKRREFAQRAYQIGIYRLETRKEQE